MHLSMGDTDVPKVDAVPFVFFGFDVGALSIPVSHPEPTLRLASLAFFVAGVLIDFGLAEPAEKWKERSEALARHRDKRTERTEREARGKQNQNTPHQRTKTPPMSATRTAAGNRGKPKPPSSTSNAGRKAPRPAAGNGTAVASGAANAGSRGNASTASTSTSREKEDRLKLLRKVERGGTTGFRAPEILWHCRDQVCMG